MTLNFSTPAINPRLGSSFAIFGSTYICLILLLVILEQLGLSSTAIDETAVAVPVFFYGVIGFMTRSAGADDFYVSGQRVPPLYNALSLCAAVFGGSILVGSIGAIFFAGIDAIAIPAGCFTGIVFIAILFVPYLRKAGAYTLPGFFYLRFGKTFVRTSAALFALVPCLMILTAETSLGAKIAALFLPPPELLGIGLSRGTFFSAVVFGSVFFTVAFGGARSATWSQCAQFIVLAAIVAPLTAVSVMRTNLPLAQLTYGGQLEDLKGLEMSKGFVTAVQAQPPDTGLPGIAPQAVARPAERAFSAFTPADFALLILCLATGVAAHPAFLAKISATPTILASRRSAVWAAVVGGAVVMTVPAYAIFTKAMAVEGLVALPASDVPAWGKTLHTLGLILLPPAQLDLSGATAQTLFRRDFAAFILPVAGGLPRVFLGLTAAAAIAALLASAAANLVAIATIASDDLYHSLLNKTAAVSRRLFVARAAMLLCAVYIFTRGGDADPLRWAISALTLSSGTFFSVLTLSIWWRKLSAAGAFAGMAAGFITTAAALAGSPASSLGLDPLTAGAAGLIASFAASVAISLTTGASAYGLDAADELRVPAGETLRSRHQRLAVRGKSTRVS